MTHEELLINGPDDASLTCILAHGAGAPMDTPFMTTFAEGLAEKGWRVVRFEFSYMAKRRIDGKKRGPSGQKKLSQEWRDVVDLVGRKTPLVLGGKSMGGRYASMLADELGVAGLICLGYPFHPPGKPEKLRTEHLVELQTPALFVQGERDPFGTRDEVKAYTLSSRIEMYWSPDGDHSLKPRKSSGRTEQQNWQDGVKKIDAFLAGLIASN